LSSATLSLAGCKPTVFTSVNDDPVWQVAQPACPSNTALPQHPPYFHDGSGAFNAMTGKCMDGSDIGSAAAPTDRVRQDLACVVNRYKQQRNLGLNEAQRSDLVEYLKSL
jgi:hypothetical protein